MVRSKNEFHTYSHIAEYIYILYMHHRINVINQT